MWFLAHVYDFINDFSWISPSEWAFVIQVLFFITEQLEWESIHIKLQRKRITMICLWKNKIIHTLALSPLQTLIISLPFVFAAQSLQHRWFGPWAAHTEGVSANGQLGGGVSESTTHWRQWGSSSETGVYNADTLRLTNVLHFSPHV